jgi:hypothetical protein
MQTIACILADGYGNKLWLKDFRIENNRTFIKYRSTYNQIPFEEVEIFLVDEGKNFVIAGDDGTVLFRFSPQWINKLIQ